MRIDFISWLSWMTGSIMISDVVVFSVIESISVQRRRGKHCQADQYLYRLCREQEPDYSITAHHERTRLKYIYSDPELHTNVT